MMIEDFRTQPVEFQIFNAAISDLNHIWAEMFDRIFEGEEIQAMIRANKRFGQRVNRSNRHKWRRCYLLERQLGPGE